MRQNSKRSASRHAPRAHGAPFTNPPPLGSQWLEHRPEEESGSYHVLTGYAKEGRIFPCVLINVAVNVVGMTSSCSSISLSWLLLLKGRVQLLQAPTIFLEFGLELF